MLLSDAVNLLRLDLFDPAGPGQRWNQSDLERAIDKAVVCYSHYIPHIASADLPIQAGQRTYAFPDSWNPSYPILWIERIWYPVPSPGRTLAFAEHSNLLDSSYAPGMGAGQQPSFTLLMPDCELPQDTTQMLRIFYATRQQLDTSGSTIPDIDRDLIMLGASSYAMQAYQVPTNDNFTFQDGFLHDRLDDSNIPAAWSAVALQRQMQFMARLQERQRQQGLAAAPRLTWRGRI
ncbi:hypothetical protein KDA_42950 [Dictyobacter alpinus]|uniref:Uncharacterized protein n=1 Tax=Dictyobacter alpinus TaxID=2014873 RepID=A0A402BBK5_9CHLR|nr:hypothetical protein [Dictyobacter alpinus]GCE28811.1 hypothetical protein KDA_42950 [Dictyobacter alpinus]